MLRKIKPAGRVERCAVSRGCRSCQNQRKQEGWVLPLQNTTQQPSLADLSDRATRAGAV